MDVARRNLKYMVIRETFYEKFANGKEFSLAQLKFIQKRKAESKKI